MNSRGEFINDTIDLVREYHAVNRILTIYYLNWKGEKKLYHVIPTGVIRFGSNEWYPEPQWLMEVVDILDGNKLKEISLGRILHMTV